MPRHLLPALAAALLLACLQPALAKPITVVTSGGRPLAGAVVRVTKLDGTSFVATLDPEGRIRVYEVPLGVVVLDVIEWKGVPVNARCVVTPRNCTVVCTKVGALVVYVVGSRGQGLRGADITILWQGKVVEHGVTGGDGSYATELPEGDYTVVASYKGREGRAEVSVAGGDTVSIWMTLDVFLEILGVPLSAAEFAGLVVALILAIVALFVGLYEYTAWRRRRLVAAVVRAR